jgi:hypothetical protein
MPSKLRQRARTLLAHFRPVEHVPLIVNDNVHDLTRIGGVSVLALPQEYSPCDLVIPTRFAATAQYLIDAGVEVRMSDDESPERAEDSGVDENQQCRQRRPRKRRLELPGLFRIPGSKVTTERLRAYFERQMYDGGGTVEDARRRSVEIEYTVRLPLLPNANVIPYQIHDVASCFKSFLGDLNGGILGSLEIFEGLRKVVLPQRVRKSTESADLEWWCIGDEDLEPVDPKHIARILCSIECAASRNLIMAVFGLLAFFMVDDEPFHEMYNVGHSTGVPAMDEVREFCLQSPATDARMTAESLGRIFAPLMLSEDAVKDIRMDFDKREHERKDKEKKRQSWTPSPLKHVSLSPNKRVISRIRSRTSLASNRTNIHINIHPHPLQSNPYLPLHEAASASGYDVATAGARAQRIHQIYGAAEQTARDTNASAHSFVRAHANCSAPNLMTMTNRSSTRKAAIPTKKEKESKTTALLHDQQARILLIANVITIILWNWKDVCHELRAVGYGRGEGRWYVGNSETDGVMRVRNEGSSFEGRGGRIVDV